GGSFAAGLKRRLAQIQAIAVAKATDLQFQTKISAAEIRVRSIDITEQRMISRLSNGDASGAEPSLLKLQGTEMVQELDELAIEALGDHAAPDYLDARYGKSNWRLAEPEDVPIMGLYLNNRAATIYGGSSEVQRNIMSKVVLGL
ncbi:MAG: acyl-CoA dehydrogenase family protein, partial [Pseudomonadota bacterium]